MTRISNEQCHAEALLQMLESARGSGYSCFILCPHGSTNCRCGTLSFIETCAMCKAFVGLPPSSFCPCGALTQPIAIKRTWIALDEGGYL